MRMVAGVRMGILLAAAAASVLAQVNSASLTGLVKDSSEAAVARAKVNATQKSTNIQRSAETDATGNYFFPILPVGDYDITVEAQGFKKADVTVTLETGQKGR